MSGGAKEKEIIGYNVIATFDNHSQVLHLRENEFSISDLDDMNCFEIKFSHKGLLKQFIFNEEGEEQIPNSISIEAYNFLTGNLMEHLIFNIRYKSYPSLPEENTERSYYVESLMDNKFFEDKGLLKFAS